MLYFIPVPIEDHDALIGKDFSKRFAKEMLDYYAPFLEKKRPVQLAKEIWEYAVADSIDGAKWVGAGKNIIDVQTPNIQIDVKGISVSKSFLTTEASILQNNKLKNDNFVTELLESKNFAGLKDAFVEPYFKKVKSTINLYYFCAIRNRIKQTVSYCLLKIVEQPNPKFIQEMCMDGTRSVSVPMIDSKYGKIYFGIPKRRLEIRLKMNEMYKFSVFSYSSHTDAILQFN